MNILFDIAHPADVHLFRHVRTKLISNGHNVIFMARDKDVVIELLNDYKIPYILGTKAQTGVLKLSFEIIAWFFKAFSIIKKNKINLAVSLSSPSTAWAAKFNRIPHIMFNDTETGVAQLIMARPATQHIYTPESLLSNWGPKQVRYKGIHDLAYLRPEYFTPIPLDLKNHTKKSTSNPPAPYAIIRFVSWGASHDRGMKKTTNEFKYKICEMISQKMDIYISAEGDLPEKLEKHRLKIPPSELHSALAYARLVIGDGATTATEAAVLGVPSIYISPFADSLGYCRLLEEYGLLISVKGEEEGLKKIEELSSNPNLKARKHSKEKLLNETIDLVDFITEKCESTK